MLFADQHTNSYNVPFHSIMALLRTAIRSGERGLLKHKRVAKQRHLLYMTRAYETALQFGLSLPLTLRQCASFDDQSHKIELLRVDLETRLLKLDQLETGNSHKNRGDILREHAQDSQRSRSHTLAACTAMIEP